MLKKSLGLMFAAALCGWHAPVQAQVVPGTGPQLVELADDFEDANWNFTLNLPKASSNIDKIDRQPAGFSSNGLWFESTYRGTPDFVKRVSTPEGGLPGSTGALALQTLYSGIPGQLSHKFQQDDLIANVSQKLGFMLPANWTPSYVVRVYVPPFEQWEQRVGSTFGFRADCQTIINKPTRVSRLFRTGGTTKEIEQYWPGFFIQFNGKNHPQYPNQNTGTILIRSGERGEDIPGPVITEPGWWTLGMTITPDGRVHYYGHAGVENLTAKDHLYSNFPYGYKCLQTSTFFFNVVNQDDGRTWSTRWIVDDPKVHVATRPYSPPAQTAGLPTRPISQTTTAPAATPATPAAVPANPVTTPAAPAATTPGAPVTPVTPAVPVASPAASAPPVAPVAPVAPAAPSAPAIAPPAAAQTPPLNTAPVPAVAPPVTVPEAAPTVPATTTDIPVPQASIAPAPLAAPANATPVLKAKPDELPRLAAKAAATAAANATLPQLLTVPVPITPVKAGAISVPAPAPALLPVETAQESAPISVPVISSPAPAPIAVPDDADIPKLAAPQSSEPTLPPAPALPQQ